MKDKKMHEHTTMCKNNSQESATKSATILILTVSGNGRKALRNEWK